MVRPRLCRRRSGLPSGTLPGRWTQTRSLDGEVTGQTFDLSGATLPLSEKGLQAVLGDTGWYETATVQDEPLLIYSQLNIGRMASTGSFKWPSPSPSPSNR